MTRGTPWSGPRPLAGRSLEVTVVTPTRRTSAIAVAAAGPTADPGMHRLELAMALLAVIAAALLAVAHSGRVLVVMATLIDDRGRAVPTSPITFMKPSPLRAATSRVLQLLRVTRLDTAFIILADEDSALSSF